MPINDWTSQDSTAACKQGWDVFEVWENGCHLEILADEVSKIFLTNVAARSYVQQRAFMAPPDPLAQKAWRLTFHSMMGARK